MPSPLGARRGGVKHRKTVFGGLFLAKADQLCYEPGGGSDVAISRKGNVGNEHAPASSPAVAHRRAKRTEWRMRGIEPNKNVTSFSPHPSCLRNASAIHLPPRGEGLIGCVHSCHLGALVEKSPATGTAQYVHAPAKCPHGLRAAPARSPAQALRPAEETALRLTQTTKYNNSIFGGII